MAPSRFDPTRAAAADRASRRSVVRLLGAAALIAMLAGCAGSTRGRHPIEGQWFVASETRGGEQLPLAAYDGVTLSFDGGRYEFARDRGDYVVLPGTTPAALDLHVTDGPDAGQTLLGIYAIKGNTMTVVFDLSGRTRPERFESRAGARDLLVELRR